MLHAFFHAILKLGICILFLSTTTSVLLTTTAGGQPLDNGAQNGALANATVGFPATRWHTPNPASAGWRTTGALSFHVAQVYGLPELRYSASQVNIPAGKGMLVAGIRTLGFAAYRDLHMEGGFTYPLSAGTSRTIMLALLGTWRQVRIRPYGTGHVFGLSLGIQMPLNPNLYFGATGRHLIQSESPIALRKTLETGLAFNPISELWLMGAVAQAQFYDASLKFGLEYNPIKQISIRYGLATNPLTFGLGAGFETRRLSFDLAAERHVVLGWTPGLSINLMIMRRKDL